MSRGRSNALLDYLVVDYFFNIILYFFTTTRLRAVVFFCTRPRQPTVREFFSFYFLPFSFYFLPFFFFFLPFSFYFLPSPSISFPSLSIFPPIKWATSIGSCATAWCAIRNR